MAIHLYVNLLKYVIARQHHLRSGDNEDQETFLAPFLYIYTNICTKELLLLREIEGNLAPLAAFTTEDKKYAVK